MENARATRLADAEPGQVGGQRAGGGRARSPTTADRMSTQRRPRRSASATMASASRAPTRVAASITPTAPSLTPKSWRK